METVSAGHCSVCNGNFRLDCGILPEHPGKKNGEICRGSDKLPDSRGIAFVCETPTGEFAKVAKEVAR